jgi:hypothetical protein
MSYDAILLGTVEVEKGVVALDVNARAADAKRQEEMFKALAASVEMVTTESAKADAAKIVAAMKVHIANFAEQEARRQHVTNTTMDNIAYIREVCGAGKQFVLYRANIGAQWKAYLDTLAKGKLIQENFNVKTTD